MCRTQSSRCSTPTLPSTGAGSRCGTPTLPRTEGPTQAVLLRGRGDLKKSSAHFEARLSKVSPISYARCDRPSAARIGMDYTPLDGKRLKVTDIDVHPRLKTPVAQLNSHENRQASRAEGEQHISRAICAGDRIRAVRSERVIGFRGAATLEKAETEMGREFVMEGDACKTMSASSMLHELSEATSFTEPQEVKLSLSRDIANVMKPSEQLGTASLPQRPLRPIALPTTEKHRTPPRLPRGESPRPLSRCSTPPVSVAGRRSHSTGALAGAGQRPRRSASPGLARALGFVGSEDDLALPRRSSQSLCHAGANAIERKTF